MQDYIELRKFAESNITQPLSTLSRSQIEDVQAILKTLGYYTIKVDGIYGDHTKTAFANWKQDVWMANPGMIGKGSARRLLESAKLDPVSEQTKDIPTKINPDAGQKTGRSMTLPTGRKVWANEFIVPGIPLTWGECTKNCTRIPKQKRLIGNAIALAKQFGEVRSNFNHPIGITSGYRPPAVNRAVGGASRSQHLHFKALDLVPIGGDINTLWSICKSSEFNGLGDARHRGFIHVDTRSYRVIFGY